MCDQSLCSLEFIGSIRLPVFRPTPKQLYNATLLLEYSIAWVGVSKGLTIHVYVSPLLQTPITIARNKMSKMTKSVVYILNCFQVSVLLFQLIRFAGDTEMQMNPVERVQFYAQTSTENYDGKKCKGKKKRSKQSMTKVNYTLLVFMCNCTF